MFGSERVRLQQENRSLTMELDNEKRRRQSTQQLLDFAQGCMDANKMRRERDKAKAELEKVKRERDKNWREAQDAKGEAQLLQRRLDLMNAEPMRYLVQSEGQEVSVIAVTHDEIPDGELALFDREQSLVASFKTYSSYRIEPIPE